MLECEKNNRSCRKKITIAYMVLNEEEIEWKYKLDKCSQWVKMRVN